MFIFLLRSISSYNYNLELGRTYNDEHCHCVKTDAQGPWCDYWGDATYPYPYCWLDGKEKAKFCPGSLKSNESEEYFSFHTAVCSKTQRKHQILR